jgi:basic membrane protein A
MSKKILAVLVILTLGLTLVTGCGSNNSSESSQDAPSTKQKQTDEKLRVALLLPGTINDSGFNAIGYQGLKAIEKELGAEVAYAENVAQSDMEEMLRNYATQGYNLIFGHGFQFNDAGVKVAPEFPDVKFIINSSVVAQEPNLASFSINDTEKGFLEGVVAALITKTNVVGGIGGMESPNMTDTLAGYAKGAKYINPDIEVLNVMSGTFEDVAKVKEIANALIEKNADVIMVSANQAGIGGIEAARDAGVLAINNNFDGYELAPDTVVVSGLVDFPKSMLLAAQKFVDGEFAPVNQKLGIKEGAVYLSSFHEFEQKLPKETFDKLNQVIEDVRSGKIDVASLPE